MTLKTTHYQGSTRSVPSTSTDLEQRLKAPKKIGWFRPIYFFAPATSQLIFGSLCMYLLATRGAAGFEWLVAALWFLFAFFEFKSARQKYQDWCFNWKMLQVGETCIELVDALAQDARRTSSMDDTNTSMYTISPDGQTVADKGTGLTWDRFALEPEDWEQAFKAAETANHAHRHGHSDWRVPTRAELMSLIDLNAKKGAKTDQAAFPDCPSCFWTCETYEPDPAYAWVVYDGDTYPYYKDNSYFVRLVRSGQ